MAGVGLCELDMCAYGLTSEDRFGEGKAMKPTRLMSNSFAILNGMPRKCPGCSRHVQLFQGRAEPAAKYTDAFCRRLIKCLEVQCLAEGGVVPTGLMEMRFFTLERVTITTQRIYSGMCISMILLGSDWITSWQGRLVWWK